MKKEFAIVAALVLAATGILFALNLTSGKPNTKKNGFTRKFKEVTVKEIDRLHFSEPVYKVCGSGDDSIFFTGKIPGKIYLATENFKRQDTFNVRLDNIVNLKSEFSTYVDFPNAYIVGGNARVFIKANLFTGQNKIIKLKTNGPFSKTVMLNADNYIVREINDSSLNTGFTKINVAIQQFEREKDIYPSVGDAGFIYDGMLHYDPATNRAVYIPFYNNNVTSFDSSFNVLHRIHTIDTIATAARRIIVDKSKTVTYDEPPIITNSHSWLYKNRLFVLSRVMSDNEINTFFNNDATVDEYDIKVGRYVGSFQIPLARGQKLVSVKMMSDNTFIALYEKEIVRYFVAANTPK